MNEGSESEVERMADGDRIFFPNARRCLPVKGRAETASTELARHQVGMKAGAGGIAPPSVVKRGRKF